MLTSLALPMHWLRVSSLAYAGLAGAAFVLVYHWRNSRIPKGLKLPPGPPGRFLIGNLLDFPRSKEWLTFNKWAKEYGDLVYINILGMPMLFVNSVELAKELFEKRGNIYSDRVHSPVLHDLIKGGWTMPIMPYGEKWRQTRAYFVQHFSQTASQNYRDNQMKYTRILVKRLYQSPEKYSQHVRYIVGATLLELAYGMQPSSEDDPYILLSENTTTAVTQAGLPGTYLVDVIPVLKYVPSWFPGAKFRRDLNTLRFQLLEMAEGPIRFVKHALKNGKANPCLTTSLIEAFENDPNRPVNYEEIIRNVSSVGYIAGFDVTHAFILQFFLAMVLHPDVQTRAQEELHEIVGSGTLPSLEDLDRLRYVKAVIYELLRWNTVVPNALPHLVTTDDVVNGYFIRKGTIIFGNTWTLLRNSQVYGEDADTFKPERFLDENTPRPEFAFGYGRRVCPGRFFGENGVLMVAACILYLFHILPENGENGPELPSEEDYDTGLILRPRPFKCRIVPRSSNAIRILEELDI